MSESVSSRWTVTSDVRGTRASAAVLAERLIDRASREASSSSNIPPSCEERISRSSSSRVRTPASSSRGSIPRRRTVQLAAAFRNTIKGRKAALNQRIGVETASAVSSGLAIAKFLGINSATTISTAVASRSASATDMASVDFSGMNERSSRRGSSARPTVGSAMNPMTSEVNVIPSCAPESWNESVLSALSVLIARLSPASARSSTLLRSTATRANSAKTKKEWRRMMKRTRASPSAVSIFAASAST